METRLVKVERDLLMIPSLAIHMDRAVNEGRAINKQVDMLPVFAGSAKEPGEMKKTDRRRDWRRRREDLWYGSVPV